MKMVFLHGFFHADPHPANVLVRTPDRLSLVDFGMVGQLTPRTVAPAGLFLDIVDQEVDRLPRRLASSASATRRSSRRIRASSRFLPLLRRGPGGDRRVRAAARGFQTIYRLNSSYPPAGRCSTRRSRRWPVGLEIYPDFNVFDVAKPYARELFIERFAPQRIARRTGSEVRNIAMIASRAPLPGARHALEQFRDGPIEVGFRHRGPRGL